MSRSARLSNFINGLKLYNGECCRANKIRPKLDWKSRWPFAIKIDMRFQTGAEILVDHPGCNPYCHACHYKHFPYSAQLERKQAWASSQLQSWLTALNPI